DRLVDVGARSGRPRRLAVLAAHVRAELGRQDDPVAPAPQHLSEQPFAPSPPAIDVRGVEELDAALQSGVHHGAGPVEPHPAPEVVASEPDDRNLEIPELAPAHARDVSGRPVAPGTQKRAAEAARYASPSGWRSGRGGHDLDATDV